MRAAGTKTLWSYTCQYNMLCDMKEAHVITVLLYKRLAKDLFLCCVPQRDTRLLRKAYYMASLLGHAIMKRTGCSISKLTWTKGKARLSPRSTLLLTMYWHEPCTSLVKGRHIQWYTHNMI